MAASVVGAGNVVIAARMATERISMLRRWHRARCRERRDAVQNDAVQNDTAGQAGVRRRFVGGVGASVSWRRAAGGREIAGTGSGRNVFTAFGIDLSLATLNRQ